MVVEDHLDLQQHLGNFAVDLSQELEELFVTMARTARTADYWVDGRPTRSPVHCATRLPVRGHKRIQATGQSLRPFPKHAHNALSIVHKIFVMK